MIQSLIPLIYPHSTPITNTNDNVKKQLSELTKEDLSSYFEMDILAASASLGVTVEELRGHCRAVGIAKWPYRYTRQSEKKLEEEIKPKKPSPFSYFKIEKIEKLSFQKPSTVLPKKTIDKIVKKNKHAEQEKLSSSQMKKTILDEVVQNKQNFHSPNQDKPN